jgi:hypothetical protein
MIIMIAETNPPAFRLLASHWGRIVFKSRNAHRRCIRGYPQMCLYMLSFGNMMKNQLILGFQTSRDKPAWVWIRGFPMGFPMMFSYSSQLLCRWKASASQLFGCDLQSAKLRVHQGLRLKALKLQMRDLWILMLFHTNHKLFYEMVSIYNYIILYTSICNLLTSLKSLRILILNRMFAVYDPLRPQALDVLLRNVDSLELKKLVPDPTTAGGWFNGVHMGVLITIYMVIRWWFLTIYGYLWWFMVIYCIIGSWGCWLYGGWVFLCFLDCSCPWFNGGERGLNGEGSLTCGSVGKLNSERSVPSFYSPCLFLASGDSFSW